MDDDTAMAEESRRLAAEWRAKVAMTNEPASKEIMQQLAPTQFAARW